MAPPWKPWEQPPPRRPRYAGGGVTEGAALPALGGPGVADRPGRDGRRWRGTSRWSRLGSPASSRRRAAVHAGGGVTEEAALPALAGPGVADAAAADLRAGGGGPVDGHALEALPAAVLAQAAVGGGGGVAEARRGSAICDVDVVHLGAHRVGSGGGAPVHPAVLEELPDPAGQRRLLRDREAQRTLSRPLAAQPSSIPAGRRRPWCREEAGMLPPRRTGASSRNPPGGRKDDR